MSPQPLAPAEFAEVDTGLPELPSPADLPPVAPADSPMPSMAAVHDIPVRVQAVLGGARMQIAQLLQTRAGSVVELDRRVGEPVDVIVNDRLIARGELVLVEGSLGVTLTEIVKQER